MLHRRVEKQKSNKPRLKIVSSILLTAMLIIATFTFSTITEAAGEEEIQINEIMYNPAGSDDEHEWIEIYNYGTTSVDLTGWKFYEGGTNHGLTLEQGSMIVLDGGYAIIADNAARFILDHPGFAGTVIDSSFSLKNTGEYIAINNSLLETVDEVTYLTIAEEGYTIEKNDLGEWKESLVEGGTPGAMNSILILPMMIEKAVWNGEDWVDETTANVDDVVRFNTSITYNKTVNHGIKLKWITIVDTLPPYLEYAYNATTTETDISIDGRNITWDLTGVELYDGDSFYLEFDANVTGCGTHVNTANVSACETCPHKWHYAEDEATVNALCPDVHLDKMVNRTIIHFGDSVTYTYYVNNTGNCNLTNIVVTDDKISSVSYVSGDTNSNSWLDLSETWIYQATDNPTQDVTNTGNVTAEDELGKKVHYEDSASVDVISPDINVTKSANITEGHVGDVANYTIVVTNTGSDPLYNVYVNDTTLGISYYTTSLAPGENKTYYVEHTLACCPDPFINTVNADGYDELGKQYTDSDDATVDIISENNPPDKPTVQSPGNNSENIDLNPTLCVSVSDPDDDTMNVSFYNASDDSFIGIDTDVTNGSTASVDWSDLSYNTTYHWYAVANDSQLETRSDTWKFTTKENNPPNKPITPAPENNSKDVDLNPTLSVDVTDPDEDTMNVSFYNASDDNLIDIATNVANGSTASVTWSDLNYNTTYYWYASASDGQASTDSEIWHFTTESKPNTIPIVDDIPNQTIAEGENFTAINLDDYVWDAEDPDENITWSYSGNIELEVDINTTNRVATITPPDENWNGQENITFTATDTGGLNGSDNATFTVTPVNDPPVVSNIPDQTIAEGEKFVAINLDDYVEDLEDPDENINWSYSGNTRLTVSIVDQIATITTPNPDWNGQETITFTAEDTGGLNDSDNATFTVTAVNDPPKVKIIKPERAVYINNEKKLPRLICLALIIGNITIEVNATDVDSRIEKVEFYINGKLMGNDTTDPYTYNWTRDRLRLIHIFCIKVVAYDNDGATAKDCMIVRKFL